MSLIATSAHLVYIHGFLSSPMSYKAQQVKAWLATHRPDIQYYCPYITSYPNESKQRLDALLQTLTSTGLPIYLMGSSLGGFWATYLAERFQCPAVLINPAVNPALLEEQYFGQSLDNYQLPVTYHLGEEHSGILARVDCLHIKKPSQYWLMVQTGDGVLDYTLAVKKYQGAKQLVEPGGDHSFQKFERWIDQCIDFLQQAS